ncbi:MAG: UvrD-helicase domain-containing protein [Patescibacteria group bacterium]|nr:UvrD-helicase domain-containing protein [Patescibacteria group bacterium]
MENLMENLNKEQLQAVQHKDGPLLIVAGAGTGKTTVITQRIAYMIEQGWAKSDEILALTFTEKAAGEMEERVDRLLPIGYLDLWISTFHGFGERILKEHGLDIGLPNDFKLLNEFEQYALIKNNLDKLDLDYYRPMGNPTKFIRALIKHFSRTKDEDINPAQYLEYANELKENLDNMLSGAPNMSLRGASGAKRNERRGNLRSSASNQRLLRPETSGLAMTERGEFNKEIASQEVARINEVANAYHVYQQLLLDSSSLDFGDLINYCLKLFRARPAILKKYRDKFKYILLDEFQDTNWAQYELIKMLAAPKNNLVVVGDDDQSIYKFRGASVSNILQFQKDYSRAGQIFLINNYRNKQNILNLSYKFIKQNDPNRLEYQLNTKTQKHPTTLKLRGASRNTKTELSKKLVADNKGEGVIEVIEGKDLNEEIRMVIEKIADLKIKDKNSTWDDFAILVRANESAKEICSFLAAAELPYQFLSSRGLYAKPVIMDIIAYLKLLDDYHESAAAYRVLNLPIFKFTYNELVNFNYWANKKAWSLYEVLRNVSALNLGPELQKKVVAVLSLIDKHAGLARDKNASEIIFVFLNDSGYLKYLMSQDEQKSREAASCLNQFMKRVEEFEKGSDDRSVKAFLAQLQMEIDAGEEGAMPVDWEAGPETIKVMTVHGAKGLEFKYVFIAGLVDKRFPTIERSEQIAIPDALVKEILPEGDIHLEEERRLFYVAMTRAKNDLYFSWAADYGGARLKKPSRFLEECGFVQENTKTQKYPATPGLRGAGKNTLLRQGFEGQAKIQDGDILKTRISVPAKEVVKSVVPSYFSYTQLAAFSNCPYQYRFAHILRIPVRGKHVFSFGKTLHITLQKLFSLIEERKKREQTDLFGASASSTQAAKKNVKISLEEILKLYEQSWIDDWYETKARKEEYKKKGKEILKKFYEKHQDAWPNVIFLEKGFNSKVRVGNELYTVRGVMDRIDEINGHRSNGAGKIKIIDYKTGTPKDKLSLDEKYQLLIYQLAAEELFRQKVDSLAFYYLDNNTEVEFLGSQDELDKTKEKIINTIAAIKKGEFPPKPSALCQFCDFKDICEFRKS